LGVLDSGGDRNIREPGQNFNSTFTCKAKLTCVNESKHQKHSKSQYFF
jgi:hypothetical protein